ncbi:MAG: hypothetical protein KA180_15865 [Gemmatimonadales bacterium]|nr:hypothetical protein [Gemmatimonadales bacterium]
MSRHCRACLTLVLPILAACTAPIDPTSPGLPAVHAPITSTGFTPMLDAGPDERYLDWFAVTLYPGGNAVPASHDVAARAAARAIVPRNASGLGYPGWGSGKVVLLSAGPSNASKEWCSAATATSWPTCTSWSFTGRATVDAAVQKNRLAIINGAMGGAPINQWTASGNAVYTTIATRLKSRGLSERQVQAVWLKPAHNLPQHSLPDAGADAFVVIRETAQALRAMRQRYPNLQLVFLETRTYAGYSITDQSPEPFAYETGIAVRWLIQAQIVQRETGAVDSIAGDMLTGVPVVTWGAYLWTDGLAGRADGLVWTVADVMSTDGMHPSTSGQSKVANLLMTFFKGSPYTRCWFLAARPAC